MGKKLSSLEVVLAIKEARLNKIEELLKTTAGGKSDLSVDQKLTQVEVNVIKKIIANEGK